MKGYHFSLPRLFGRFKDIHRIVLAVKFNSTCYYKFNDVNYDLDINKLFGVSYGFLKAHRNSVRIGWNLSKDKVALWLYYYEDSVRKTVRIGDFAINKFHTIELIFNNSTIVVRNKDRTIIRRYNIPKKNIYLLQPYFGGDKSSPHDMNVELLFHIE